ncbi:MAG: hypothetical protein AAF713_12890 [Pseudomonadota bacterium]
MSADTGRVAGALGAQLSGAGLVAMGVGAVTNQPEPEGWESAPPLEETHINMLREAGIAVTAIGTNRAEGRVTVFLSKALPARLTRLMPEEIGEVSVHFRAQRVPAVNPGRQATHAGLLTDAARGQATAIPCGSSISPGNARLAGTMGALVQLQEDGFQTLYGLTCNHVTGGCNNVPQGMPVVSPGILDVDQRTERIAVIGYQDRFLPLRQGLESVLTGGDNDDAALFRIHDPNLVSSAQGRGMDTPETVIEPEGGMRVRKAGSATGIRRGVVDEFTTLANPYNYQVPINAREIRSFRGTCNFRRVWRIDSSGDSFAERGDSGALVTTDPDAGEEPAAIGLLIAAETNGDAYIVPLGPLLEKFGARLVAGHNR